MVYIRTDSDNMIVFIHRQPFDPINGLNESKEDLEKYGFFIDSMPDPMPIFGKSAVPYFNPETKKVYYKYVPSQLSSYERLDMLEEALNEILLNHINGGGDD